MENIKEKVSKENFISEIESELDLMENKNAKELTGILNAYFEEIKSECEVHENTFSEIDDIFENDLWLYFENLDHCERFEKEDKFVFKKDGWWNTAEWIADVIDLAKVAEYVYDHMEDFEDYFDYDDIFNWYEEMYQEKQNEEEEEE